MAIKGGQIVHVGNGTFLIDRIQTAGPGSLNIPTEKIYELGNYKSVATIRDTPDISFSLESFDVSVEVEKMLTDSDDSDFATGVDLATAVPVDIASQFKAGLTATDPYTTIASVALPYLYLESASYRFGVGENSTQTFSLRGDSIFYNPGATFVQTATASGSPGQTVITSNPAYQVAEGDERRVLSVCVGETRLSFGADYTETYGVVSNGAAVTTVHITDAYAGSPEIRIMYASPTAQSFPQVVHPDTTVKPAAVRGKDVDIYVGGYDPSDVSGSADNKLVSVQNVTVDWRVTLERDEEMGNAYIVAQDFEVPDVSGTLTVKPRNPAELAGLIRKVQGVVDATKVLSAQTAVPLELDIVIREPGTQNVMKRLHVPDARFSLPGFTGRVQTKTTWDLPWSSDEGTLEIFDGSVEAGSS
jgi:hypothetical protein